MAFVEFEQRGHVGLITINRPEVLNALNLEVIEQLDDILLRAESQEDVHVIVITGAGRSFVAGADIGEMVNYTADDAKRFSHHGNNTMMHITRFPSPVIAAVNGFALGGGCELAMSCDIILAAGPNAEGKGGAKFGQPEVGLGITPGFSGTQRLPRRVGVAKAKELIFSGKQIGAEEAKRSGLVDEKALFSEEELRVLHAGLVKMSILDQDVSNDARESVERILDKIEEIMPELREADMDFDFDMEFGLNDEMEMGG